MWEECARGASQTAAGLLPSSEARLAGQGPASLSRSSGSPPGIPEARAHPHSLPSWALASTVTLSDPLLWPFWPLSLLMPPLPPSGLTPGITPALAAQVLGVHSWGSSDGTAWGPGLPWLKGESGECVGSCNCRGCRGGNHFS